jgi:hypothetical protein
LLLAQFDHVTAEGEPHERGFLLHDLLNRLFLLHGITVIRAFQRNDGGKQIDAAFEMDGWHYLVECRWRAKLANIRELDGLSGQVARSGRQTMGLFLSINGWSENVVPLLKQNPEKSILLMEGNGPSDRAISSCRSSSAAESQDFGAEPRGRAILSGRAALRVRKRLIVQWL